jgi:hypothetical protein
LVNVALPTEGGCCDVGSLRIEEGALLLLLPVAPSRRPGIGADPELDMPDDGVDGSMEETVFLID